MDFIINNYLWFGIAGVVLLMALIGFLAEKTNFITGGESKPKSDKKKKNKVVEDISTNDVVEEMKYDATAEDTEKQDAEIMSFDENMMEEVPVTNNTEEIEVLEVNTNDNAEPVISDAPITNDMWSVTPDVATETATVTETGEDLTVPLENVEVQKETPIVNNDAIVTPEEDEDIWKF